MANYYTKMSFLVEAPEGFAGFLEQVREYGNQIMHGDISLEDGEQKIPDTDRPAFLCARSIYEYNEGVFDADIDEGIFSLNKVSISATEANPDSVAMALQGAMKHFDMKGMIGFEWSNDSDRMTADAFGGGAAVVTQEKILWCTTREFLEKAMHADPEPVGDTEAPGPLTGGPS